MRTASAPDSERALLLELARDKSELAMRLVAVLDAKEAKAEAALRAAQDAKDAKDAKLDASMAELLHKSEELRRLEAQARRGRLTLPSRCAGGSARAAAACRARGWLPLSLLPAPLPPPPSPLPPLPFAQAAEMENANRELLRAHSILGVRGALELLLRVHAGGDGVEALTAYLSRVGGVGEVVLNCCNESTKVVSDNWGQPHTAASLARVIMAIKQRLNKDAHDGRTGEAYERSGDMIVLRRNGFSESDVTVLSCLLTAHKYPVRLV